MAKNALPSLFFLLILSFISCADESSALTDEDNYAQEYLEEYEGPVPKWGFMDRNGHVQIAPEYDQVSAFTEGLAAVNYEGRWGYIDRQGKVVIPFQFLAAWPFNNGRARVTLFSGNQCFISMNGEMVCPTGAMELSDVSEGRIRIITAGGEGFINTEGDTIYPPIAERVESFRFGSAVVVQDGKAGLIDTAGRWVVKPELERIQVCSNGILLIRENGSYDYASESQEYLSDGNYSRATVFFGDVAAVKKADSWYLINSEFSQITEETYNLILPSDLDGVWIARKETGFGLIDSRGTELTPFTYQQINKFSEGFAVYRRDGLCGYLDAFGRELTPPQYGLAWEFSEGLARAAFRDGIAYIDSNAQIPFIPDYYEIRDFSEGLAAFQEN